MKEVTFPDPGTISAFDWSAEMPTYWTERLSHYILQLSSSVHSEGITINQVEQTDVDAYQVSINAVVASITNTLESTVSADGDVTFDGNLPVPAPLPGTIVPITGDPFIDLLIHAAVTVAIKFIEIWLEKEAKGAGVEDVVKVLKKGLLKMDDIHDPDGLDDINTTALIKLLAMQGIELTFDKKDIQLGYS